MCISDPVGSMPNLIISGFSSCFDFSNLSRRSFSGIIFKDLPLINSNCSLVERPDRSNPLLFINSCSRIPNSSGDLIFSRTYALDLIIASFLLLEFSMLFFTSIFLLIDPMLLITSLGFSEGSSF